MSRLAWHSWRGYKRTLFVVLSLFVTLVVLAHRLEKTGDDHQKHLNVHGSVSDDRCEPGTLSVHGLQHSPDFKVAANNTQGRIRPILSMASTEARLVSHQLATTLKSLVSQSYRPEEIRVYLSTDARTAWESYVTSRSGSWLQKHLARGKDTTVKPYFVEDIGPATKFVYVLTDLVEKEDLDRPVIILDDDHYYSPDLLSTLTLYSSLPAFHGASIGLRGWRVRRDIMWGVPWSEYDDHVVVAQNLDEVYRVSVCTANDGYLVYPRWFMGGDKPEASNKTESVEEWAASATDASGALDTIRLGATQAHLVDDIWMAGNLAAGRIQKYVVPLNIGYSRKTRLYYTKGCSPNVDLTEMTDEHSLEDHMKEDGHSRPEANNFDSQAFCQRVEG